MAFSHYSTNSVNIGVALESKRKGMKVVVFGSAAAVEGKKARHSSGKNIFEIADIVAEILVDIGVKLFIHSSHHALDTVKSKEGLGEALAKYKRRVAEA